jgi:hypothetical protein
MSDALGAQLLERGRLYLGRTLRKVERDVRRDPRSHAGLLVHPMLDVTDATGGTHVMMLMDLPDDARERARRVAAAVVSVDGIGFLWMYDAFVTTKRRDAAGGWLVEGRSEALCAVVQTRDGFIGGLSGRYTRQPWTFDRVVSSIGTTMLIQIPTWPGAAVH